MGSVLNSHQEALLTPSPSHQTSHKIITFVKVLMKVLKPQSDARRRQPTDDSASPLSIRTIYRYHKHLLRILKYRHSNSEAGNCFDVRTVSRLESFYNKMCEAGKLTRDYKSKRASVSSSTVLSMLNSWRENAFDKGARSCDQVALYALAVVLMTATVARTGDNSLSSGYDESCSLRRRDVDMKLGDERSLFAPHRCD
ncbi:hypothetical protein BDW69DRAFT_185796 [Aspergillus filifer]